MQGDLLFPVSLLSGFLLVLARVSGVFAFLPIPGVHSGPAPARVVLSLTCTMALFPVWPAPAVIPGPSQLVGWLILEAAMGTAAGIVFAYISEAFVLGAQVLSLQAGYAYASTIDPNTQADSGILMIFAQLLSGMLFFAAGLDRHIMAAFAASLEAFPPGTFSISAAMATRLTSLGATVFELACRVALPIIALLLMVDLTLGVLGRINAQLQAGSLSFPLKMMLVLGMLALMMPAFPVLYSHHASAMLAALRGLIATL